MSQLKSPGFENHSPPIQVYCEGERYFATIAGGWWFAYGKTAESAARAVEKRYNDEMEYHK